MALNVGARNVTRLPASDLAYRFQCMSQNAAKPSPKGEHEFFDPLGIMQNHACSACGVHSEPFTWNSVDLPWGIYVKNDFKQLLVR